MTLATVSGTVLGTVSGAVSDIAWRLRKVTGQRLREARHPVEPAAPSMWMPHVDA